MRTIYTILSILLFSASNFALETKFTSVVAEQATPTNIETFSIDGINGDIDAEAKTIAVELPAGTKVTSLKPAFTLSEGANAYIGQVTTTTLQESEISEQDFTDPVVYKVVNDTESTDWTVTVTLEEPDAVNDINFNQVSMYPNPVNSALTIANLDGAKEIIVSNVLGKTMLVKPVGGIEMTINTSEFKTGIYVVTIVGQNSSRSERIIKQ